MIELRWWHDGLGGAPVLQYRVGDYKEHTPFEREWVGTKWKAVPHATSRDEEKPA